MNGTRDTWPLRQFGIVLSVSFLILFSSLGGPRLWDRDEPRNAGCAYEMIERGDWVVPVFNAELRTHKPVLLYWLIMSAYETFGVNEFAARFWSAVLGIGTVACTYLMAYRLAGRSTAFWSALALTTMLMFAVASRAATPDSVLIFPCTLATLIYVFGTFKPHDPAAGARLRIADRFFPTNRWIIVAMYASMGVAVLAKGPVGLVMPTAVIGMFMLLKRLPHRSGTPTSTTWSAMIDGLKTLLRSFAPMHFLRTCLTMNPLIAIGMVLLIALPWYTWVGLRTNGEWLEGFFLTHNLGRATTAMEDHNGSILFYPVAILVGAFPWSVFALPILIDTVRQIRNEANAERDGQLLMACWVGVYVGIFSIARTKLPSYITPCYPAVAILAGGFVARWLEDRTLVAKFWSYAAFGSFVAVGTILAIALPIAASTLLPEVSWLGVVVGLIPIVGGVAAIALTRVAKREWAAFVFAAASVALTVTMFSICATRVSRFQPSLSIASFSESRENIELSAIGQLEPSWVFYAQRPIGEVHNERALRKALSEPHRVVIINDETLEEVSERIGSDEYRVVKRVPQFLRSGELLLIEGTTVSASRSANVDLQTR